MCAEDDFIDLVAKRDGEHVCITVDNHGYGENGQSCTIRLNSEQVGQLCLWLLWAAAHGDVGCQRKTG